MFCPFGSLLTCLPFPCVRPEVFHMKSVSHFSGEAYFTQNILKEKSPSDKK